MIASMTAFARESTQGPWGQAIWEIRSVNHRYCELFLKIPDFCRVWENDWRQQMTENLQRGKIEAHLSFTPSTQIAPQLQINSNLVKQLLNGCEQIQQFPGVKPEIDALDILKWPLVLHSEPADWGFLQAPLTALLRQTALTLQESRTREGQQMKAFLAEKLQALREQMGVVKSNVPVAVEAQLAKLRLKLKEFSQKPDQDRLEQELVYYAQRLDVAEEIARLESHGLEMDRILKGGGSVGRRLDFLMQEMNREVNTIASKSLQEQMTTACIEMKVLIEQMREQIQNLV